MFKNNRDTWVALFATLFILFLFQVGAYITAPSISLKTIENVSSLSQLLNLLGGGGLKKVSLFSVGISPYITAQIIIQMLSNDVIKHFSELRKSGERGRYKLELYTRLLTFPIAVFTALGTMTLVSGGGLVEFKSFSGSTANKFGELYFMHQMLLIILFVSGTYISLFLADIISKQGLGNGITLIIMSGIISSLPENFMSAFAYLSSDKTVFEEHKNFIAIFKFMIYLFFYLLVLLLITFINGSVRKIPVQQIGQGLILDKKKLSYLPIKLMPAGIIPVVFAGSLMVLPSAISELFKYSKPGAYEFIQNYLSLNSGVGLIVYALIIILFSFLYSFMQLDVEEITDNFRKSGRFIPGIRSGQPTYNYLNSVINRINCFGAPFLAFIAVLPSFLNIVANLPGSISLGGTGIIILVSGSTQILDAIKSNNIASKYKIQHKLLHKHIEAKNTEKREISQDQLYLW